ncbi:MAG: hypothetical protein KJ955_00755 [Nanoarchaeota archaeon]|nr:hypothetical protein [Nanoarchaeota archaeon]
MNKKIIAIALFSAVCISLFLAAVHSDDVSTAPYNIRPIVSCLLEPDLIPVEQCDKWDMVVGTAYESYYITLQPDEEARPVWLTFPYSDAKQALNRREIACTDPKQIALAKFVDGEWQILSSSYEEDLLDSSGNLLGYIVGAEISEQGIYAIVKRTDDIVSESDVSSENYCIEISSCGTLGAFAMNPSKPNLGDTITFSFCGIVKGCDLSPGEWSFFCPFKEDESQTCTSARGDCCYIAEDGICDADCWPKPFPEGPGTMDYVDPDCIDLKANPGCRWTRKDRDEEHSEACDRQCTDISDFWCGYEEEGEGEGLACTFDEGDCCLPERDGECDPDCGNRTHLADGNIVTSFVDPDCCAVYDIPADGTAGNCCVPLCDGICDRDCMFGIDPDCSATRCPRLNNNRELDSQAACCIRRGDGICDLRAKFSYADQYVEFKRKYERLIANQTRRIEDEGLEGEDAEIYNRYIAEYLKYKEMYTFEDRSNSPEDCG